MSTEVYRWLTGVVAVGGLVVVTQGCSGGVSTVTLGGDSGADTSTADRADTSTADRADSGRPTDASTHADAAPHDAHVTSDSGLKPDAGTADAGGTPDATLTDAGMTTDSGTADSASKPDSSASKPDAGSDARTSDSGVGCVISGMTYTGGAVNPTNACESCQPMVAATTWSNLADGTACSNGGVCHAGTCASGCEIAGSFSAANAADPSNACESCQPAKSTTGWSNLGDGTPCGNGQICASGACGTQCDIAGVGVVASSAPNPLDPCESCQPGTSTTAWTSTDGINANCAAGEVCKGSPATCAAGCWIAGAFVSSGATANNGCEVCTPASSTTAYTDVSGAASCPTGKTCNAGTCAAGCSIGGTFVTSGTTANNGCEVCTPSSSTTSWTDVFGSASCPAGQVCNAGSCGACQAAATWSMVATSVTASPFLCEGVTDCTNDCSDFNGTSTLPDATTVDWMVDPGGTICTVFSGPLDAMGNFMTAATNCGTGNPSTFTGSIDLTACMMTGTMTWVIGAGTPNTCTITTTITGVQ